MYAGIEPRLAVLALKYRSSTFDQVVGRRTVVQTLKNSLTHGRI